MLNERAKQSMDLLMGITATRCARSGPSRNRGLHWQIEESRLYSWVWRVTTMSITLEYGVIIFFGLLKILDILTTTALNKLEECRWLLLLVFYATDYYLRNQCFTFGAVTTSATSEKTKNLDYNATRLKMPSSFSDLTDYNQIPKELPTVIFDWLLFRPPDYFFGFVVGGGTFPTTRYLRLLGNFTDYYFFRLLGISDYCVFFPTTIFSGLLKFSVFFRTTFFSDYYYTRTTMYQKITY